MKDFVELIRENAKLYPDNVAVIDGSRRITYSEFISLVNSISHRLIATSSKPKVIIDLKQGIESYALIVAVLNVRGTYCPLNPDAPIDRKMQIVNEFAPDLIVCDDEGKALELRSDGIVIDKLLTNQNDEAVEVIGDQEDIIYVIYTSGTTGVPKGVMICRKALNKFLEWSIPTYGANQNDVWGQYSFLSFDLSVVDIFTCLCSGSTLFAMNDIAAKKNRPAGIIERERITIWHSIPSAVEFMIRNEKSKVYDFSSLRLMSFCGEPLRKNQVDFLFNKKPDLTIFNTYGPTEGTLFCTWQKLNSSNYNDYCHFTLSIGKAIPGWNLKLTPVDGFVELEIIIYGEFIGKGYLGNVADEKFKDLEINGQTAKAFESGDMVTEINGNLYFSCRKDRQVKIKGFRVELDEIDFMINEFLGKASVTVVKRDVLYSFIEGEEIINETGLREFLKRKLEAFKIPNSFYSIKEIPRSQNLKINTQALIELIP